PVASTLSSNLCSASWFSEFFFSSRRRHTRFSRDWSSDVCSSDLLEAKRQQALQQIKARPTLALIASGDPESMSQLMWRLSLPLAVLNLALIALPLGAVNPRLGRSGDLLIAGLLALLYMNLINLSRGWIANGTLSFGVGLWLVHAAFLALGLGLMWRRIRMPGPRRRRCPAAGVGAWARRRRGMRDPRGRRAPGAGRRTPASSRRPGCAAPGRGHAAGRDSGPPPASGNPIAPSRG